MFVQLVRIAHTLVFDILVVDIFALGVDVVFEVVALALQLSQFSLIGVIQGKLVMHLILLFGDVDLVIGVVDGWADFVFDLSERLLIF